MTPIVQITLGLLAALFVACVLIPVIAGPARRFGLLDHPDHRKRHIDPTPLTGGLAIFAGFIVGMLVTGVPFTPFWTLILGMLALMLVGLADDLMDIPATTRLLIQIGIGCLMVYGGGISVNILGTVFGPAAGTIGLGPFAGPFSVACVVLMINAINMSDGLDGLAGGTALFIFMLLALIGWLDGAPADLVAVSMLLALATLGFLIHNVRMPTRQRAAAFLGDTGSMLLGYSIAWVGIVMATHESASIYPVSIAWLMVVPTMDTLALFFRRIHLGRSPFAPDRTHLHHIIRRCGYGVATCVHLIHLMVVATGLFGILAWQQGWPQWLMFLGVGAILFGYQVFLANAHRVLRWHRRRQRAKVFAD